MKKTWSEKFWQFIESVAEVRAAAAMARLKQYQQVTDFVNKKS